MQNQQDKLKALRKELKYGAIKRIALKVGVTQATVHAVLRGVSSNVQVLNACLDEVAEQQNVANELANKLARINA